MTARSLTMPPPVRRSAFACPSAAGRFPHAVRSARQRGVVALSVSGALFFVAMLVLLYVNRGAIFEQRMSANEVRAKQAFQQAVAGLDHALAYMRLGGIDQNNDNTPDAVNGGLYRAVYCDTAAALPACPTQPGTIACTVPANFTDVQVLSCGWSDDNGSVQRVVQRLRGSPSTAGNAATPLVSKSTTNLLVGGASVLNYYNDLTVWSGGPTLGQSNTGKTFIRDGFNNPAGVNPRNVGNSPACNNPPSGYTCSTQGSTIGHDVVTGDTSLSTASAGEFFARFFGKQPSDYRATTVTAEVAAANVGSLDGMQNQVIWVEGDAAINGGTIGTAEKPVILIVNGNLALSGNLEINGLVYVVGNFDSTGGPNIYGSLITAGSATATGNLNIIYDPNVLSRVSTIGRAARVPGTFRDW